MIRCRLETNSLTFLKIARLAGTLPISPSHLRCQSFRASEMSSYINHCTAGRKQLENLDWQRKINKMRTITNKAAFLIN